MRFSPSCFLWVIVVAGCSSQQASTNVVDNVGARNDAYRAAAERYGIAEDWLVAVGYQQGRFEPAEAVDDSADHSMDTPAMPAEPQWSLDADTPVDELDAAPDNSADPIEAAEPARGWGVMYLTDDQIARAATLTGRDPEQIRTNIAANIDGAAALLADSGADLRAATLSFLDVHDEAADLALRDLDDVVANGFDLTTEDGERIALVGTQPDTQVTDSLVTDFAGYEAGTEPETVPIEAVAPGHYPKVQWIPSPNHSSRLGYPIRYVVVHDIEGTMASAVQIFRRASSQVSAHYIVREHDGHIVKMVLESQNAWHVGHGWFNRHSVGIEHEGFAFRKKGGGYYTERMYQASAKLACAIAHRNHIPVDRKHIFGHLNVPSSLASHTLCSDARGIAGHCGGVGHHSDPGRYWNWHRYMQLVASCVNAAH
jgi:N-acetyl-anhydromuramyl-L-alanine amidase AmpD